MPDHESGWFAKKMGLSLRDRHRRLIAMIKANRHRLALSMGCMLVTAAATSASAILVKPVLDEIFFNKDIGMLKLSPGHHYRLFPQWAESIRRRIFDELCG